MNSMDRYIKKFQTGNDVQNALDSFELIRPYVAYVVEGDYIDWNSKNKSYKDDYLTLVALEDTKFSITSPGYYQIFYSIDSGNSWYTLAVGQETPTVSAGKRVLFRGNVTGTSTEAGISFVSTGRFNAEGNIMSIHRGTAFKNVTTINNDYVFRGIFENSTNLVSAENLVLPLTTLRQGSYYEMFKGCTSLTTPPKLPANNVDDYCCQSMFENCTSLTTAPELPATTLTGIYCYAFMFKGCTSLTTAPELPATNAPAHCYSSMFEGCTSLTKAPSMLAATTYTLGDSCYSEMFSGCTSLTTAPELPATSLNNRSYRNMFNGCTSLNYIKCLATGNLPTYSTSNWVQGVSPTGTFVKASSMNNWSTGTSGIPTGWTVQDA